MGQFATSLRPLAANVREYVALCEEAREAFDLMMGHAETLGANTIVGIHYIGATNSTTTSTVLAYGAAVVVEAVL